MAVSGLGAAQRLGMDVPGELSIVAWDDSVLCELVHPPLTALTHDVPDYGAHAARALAQAAAGAEVGNYEAPAPVLTVRASTGAPARRGPARFLGLDAGRPGVRPARPRARPERLSRPHPGLSVHADPGRRRT